MKLIEMDLFKYHDKPEDLKGHHEADDLVPERIYNLVGLGKKLTPKQEDVMAKYSNYAFTYARYVLKGPFPKGEDAIAKDPEYAFIYAYDVLKGSFPKGEDAIAKNAKYAFWYAQYVLKKPWPKGEDTIAKNTFYKKEYEKIFGVKL